MLDRIFRSVSREGSAAGDVRRGRAVVTTCAALLSEAGEVSGAMLAAEAIDAYRSLNDGGREAFFDLLLTAFSPDPAAVQRAVEAYSENRSQINLLHLQQAVESPRQELFRRFNLAPGGTAVLLALRSDVLRTLQDHPERAVIDVDLVHLFRSWFNRGFLVLQRIDWRTSALVLERLIAYEAVHAIQGWKDLRRRLEADRRCYAYFHPVLPDEPLIFIEVALTNGMSSKVQPLVDAGTPVIDPQRADCANFYSITNCQDGLRGVSFGNFLIKQVVEDLGREFPKLKTFATLSPIPSFQQWLSSARERLSPQLAALLESSDLRGALSSVADSSRLKERSDAVVRPVPAESEKRRCAARSRCALSSRQRRVPSAIELDGGCIGCRDTPIAGSDGQLSVPAGRRRAQPRGVRQAPSDHRVARVRASGEAR